MSLKSFCKKNSRFGRICSIMLAVVMVFNLMMGYCAMSDAVSEEVQAATTAPYRNVLYYGEWSIYAGQKNFMPNMIDGSLITHLNFAFMDVDAEGNLLSTDYWADCENPNVGYSVGYDNTYAGVLGAMVLLRNKYPNMKIGISVGGWTRSGDFPKLAGNATTRRNFARNIAKFVHYYGYDFVDIDWEYPTADRDPDPEGNGVTIDKGCKGSEADTQNFTSMLQDIRDELDSWGTVDGKHYELSVAMSASPAMMAKVEYDKVLNIVDFANMMTYDLNGAWNGYTGHQTALYVNDSYNHETQKDGQFSVDTCVKYLEDTYGSKIDFSKIVIGVAPYTRGWAEVKNDGPDPSNPGLYATATPNSVKAADGTTSGTYAYSDIGTLISQYGLKEYYDEKAQAAYYYNADTGYFFTCDNERSVAAKGQYVKDKHLGGLISWMASLDAANSISKVMHDSLYGAGTALPAQDIKMPPAANIDTTVTASGNTYTITIKNNNSLTESSAGTILNPTGDKAAMPYAEKFAETLNYPVYYVKTASGETLTGDWSWTTSAANGYTKIVASSSWGSSLAPGDTKTITLTTSGTANVSDIVSVQIATRATDGGEEMGTTVLYGEGGTPVVTTKAPEQTTTSGGQQTTTSGGQQTTTSGGQQTTTKSEQGGNTGTGSYEEWTIGKNYNIGDLVSYQGKVYECIRAIPGQQGWDPVSLLNDFWKERPDLVNSGGNGNTGGENQTTSSSDNNYTVNGTLPQHMVTGYWHNFSNGSTNLKLSEVPIYYDMICVAFTGNTSTPGEATFSVSEDLQKSIGYTDEQFIQDIKTLKSKGQHVIISVGGAEGRIEINSDAAANTFANSMIAIIEKYGFEGVDIDLEGAAVSGTNYIASALRKMHDHFGDDFIITMAPETAYMTPGGTGFSSYYWNLAISIKDILTTVHTQFYNSGGMNGYGGAVANPGNGSFPANLCTLYIESGLRPDQVAIGVPSNAPAASSGQISPQQAASAYNAMINGTAVDGFTPPKAYPTFRGLMTWSINWDATQGYAWAKAAKEAVSNSPVVDQPTKPTEQQTTPKPSEQQTTPKPSEQQTTPKPSEQQTTTQNSGIEDELDFNPADLAYTTITCEGNGNLSLEWAIKETTIDGLVPWYGDAGNTLALQFSADAGVVSDVIINGQPAGDIVTEKAPGVVKVNPTKLADNAYSIIKVKAANGEFIFVVRKGNAPVVTTPAVTTPAVTTPEATTPAATTPAVTTPEATTPAVTTPAVTTPEVTTPAVTTPDTTTPTLVKPDVTTSEVTTPTESTTSSGSGNVTTAKPTTASATVAPTKNTSSAANVSVAKTKVKKLKKKLVAKKAKIKLKKISGARYQVKISTVKKFKKKKTVSKKVKKATFTIKSRKIKGKKRLYVKARAYKVVNGKTYYGKWSKIKKVNIKK